MKRSLVPKRSLVAVALPGSLLFLWLVGLWVLSSLPGSKVSLPPIPYADKVAHFGYFLGGGFLLAWSLQVYFSWRRGMVILVTLGVMAAVGAGDELHQLFTPNRSGADLGDWIADFLGSLVGVLGFIFIHGKIISRRKSS